jgi:hypothetical protein
LLWSKAVVHSLEGVPSENVPARWVNRGSFCPSTRAMDSIRRIGRIFFKFSLDLFFDYPYKLLVKSFTAIEFFALRPHFCANPAFLGLKCSNVATGPVPRALSSPLLSLFDLRTTMTASSHPPIVEEPSSLCSPPQRHAFLSSLPPFCSAGASVSSSAASICNCHHLYFCAIDLPLHTTRQRARDPPSLCFCYFCHAFPSPLSQFCSAGMSISSTEKCSNHIRH